MLGTPPAFVLSQDQTLKLIFDSLSRILTFSFDLTQKNSDCFQRRLLCTSNFHLVIILHCLVFKDQSSYIIWKILRFFSYPAAFCFSDVYYVTTSQTCCQSGFLWYSEFHFFPVFFCFADSPFPKQELYLIKLYDKRQ